MEAGAPVVSRINSWHRTPDAQRLGPRVHPGIVHITFHRPLDPAAFADRDELMEAVRAAIASGLPAWMSEPSTENA